MLAKQAWRLATDPDSLRARVLKARYFADKDFMDAKCPKKASFTWRSILHGRELLKEGVVWRVGDGEKVRVWDHNWIPRSYLGRPLSIKPNKVVNKVSELLLPGGRGAGTSIS
jgi:hypothetical protein